MLSTVQIKQEVPEGETEYFDLTSQLHGHSESFETSGDQNTDDYTIDSATLSYLINKAHVKTEDIPESEIANEVNHEFKNNLKCTYCDFTTTGFRELELHQQLHDPLNSYSDECDFGTSNPSLLFNNKHSVNPKNKYQCEFCSYSASDTFRIKRHLSSHKTEREHVCETCDSRFKDKSTLRSHQKIHTDSKPHKCTFCDYASVRSTSLTLHMRTHTGEKPYVCLYCGHSSAYQRHFKLHLMRVHFNMKPFKCELCEYTTTESCQLNRHRRVHLPKELLVTELVDKEYRCSECPFVTSRGSSLNRHKKIHTGDKPFVCFDCGHATAYKNHLILHRMRAHLGLRPHQCSLCPYSASARSQLKRHMLTHAKNNLTAFEVPAYEPEHTDGVEFISIKSE